jgi:hypothetical protein
MKVAALFAVLCLCSCKTSQPKTAAVAFNGWHGKDFLNQGCIMLQREHDRVSGLPAQQQAMLFAVSNRKFLPCLSAPEVLNRSIEGQLLTAFAANPECHGVSVSQGYYGPNETTTAEAGQQFLRSEWRLSLDLTPSEATGDISLSDSQWTLSPRSLSGPLANMEKATTDICRIVKGQGAQ